MNFISSIATKLITYFIALGEYSFFIILTSELIGLHRVQSTADTEKLLYLSPIITG